MAAILTLPEHNNEFDIEFLPFMIKIIPLIFSLGGMIFALIFYFIYYKYIDLLSSSIYKYLINFLVNKWYFDYINNNYLAKPTLKISYNFFFKELDKGFFELFGPFGVSIIFYNLFKYSLQKVMLREATVDEYLSMAVKSVYQLQMDENKEALLADLNSSKLYYFVFNYRADYEGDDAFLISNGTEVFAITGMKSNLEFIGLEDNEQELVSQEAEAVEDDMDFAMF